MERWKEIKNYEDCYEISDLGRVRRTKASPQGKTYIGKILKPRIGKTGYYQARLHKNGVTKFLYTSRLVAEAFIPNPDNKPDVNHKNGIKSDNSATNLEWVTKSENMQHAIKNGLWNAARGEHTGSNKLTESEVLEIRRLAKQGISQYVLSAKFGVAPSTIFFIKTKKKWAWLE
jgi:hypothetical protein